MSFPPWASVDVLKELTLNVSKYCERIQINKMTQLYTPYDVIRKVLCYFPMSRLII